MVRGVLAPALNRFVGRIPAQRRSLGANDPFDRVPIAQSNDAAERGPDFVRMSAAYPATLAVA